MLSADDVAGPIDGLRGVKRKDKAILCLDHLTRNGSFSRSEAGSEQLTSKKG